MLRYELPDVDFSDISFEDAFSKDLEAQKRITVVFGRLLEMRERILMFLMKYQTMKNEGLPAAAAGLMH